MQADDAEYCASVWVGVAALSTSEVVASGEADVLRGGTGGRWGVLMVAWPGSVFVECLLSVCAELRVVVCDGELAAALSLCLVSVSFFSALVMSALTWSLCSRFLMVAGFFPRTQERTPYKSLASSTTLSLVSFKDSQQRCSRLQHQY